MTENNSSQTEGEKQEIPWVKIVLAILALLGAVFGGAGVEWVKLQFQNTPTPIASPTATQPIPISTRQENLVTPIGTSSATSSPQPAAGTDWESNCINTFNWKPDLENEIAEAENACYNLIPWGIAANNGNLLLTTTSQKNPSALEYGIFTALTQSKTFKFSIRARELTNSEVWLGFFSENSLESNGILISIQNDDNFDVREMPSEKEYADNIHLGTEDGNYENILIEFVGATLYVTVDGQPVVAGYPISVSPRHLFLGYRMLPKGEIKATIRSMEIH